MTPLTMFMPEWSRGFMAGALVTSGVWLSIVLALVGSGTASLMMGEIGEQWTAQELRPLRRRGWKLINRVLLKQGDIDHVAIGAGGVLVVETKWSSRHWELGCHDDRIISGVDQVRQNARSLRLYLKGDIGDAPVRPVVVLWDPDARREPWIEIDDVTVVSGPSLADWLQLVVGDHLREDQVDEAWRTLERHLAKRDAFELERNGPAPKSGVELAWEWGSVALAAGVGVCAAASLVGLFGALAGVLLTATVLLGVGLIGLRSDRLRMASVGWLGGSQFLTVAFIGAVAFDRLGR